MVYIDFVELHSQMFHAKFKIISPLALEKKVFQGFHHIWAWWPSWSCDLGHLYKLLFPLPKDTPYEGWLRLAMQFQKRRCLNITVIYMYIAPGQGQATPWGQNFFININFLSICPFPACFPYQMTFYQFSTFKCMAT